MAAMKTFGRFVRRPSRAMGDRFLSNLKIQGRTGMRSIKLYETRAEVINSGLLEGNMLRIVAKEDATKLQVGARYRNLPLEEQLELTQGHFLLEPDRAKNHINGMLDPDAISASKHMNGALGFKPSGSSRILIIRTPKDADSILTALGDYNPAQAEYIFKYIIDPENILGAIDSAAIEEFRVIRANKPSVLKRTDYFPRYY
jgi:hypothetical protein